MAKNALGKAMIKAAIFDCFGVLTQVDTWRELCAQAPADKQATIEEYTKLFNTGVLRREKLVEHVAEILGISQSAALEAITSKDYKNHTLFDYIGKLKSKGVKIGLLSNVGDNWIRESFLSPDELGLFDTFVMSYEVGLAKPDAEIFYLTLEKLGVSAEETVFVDDYMPNCQAASAVGLRTVHYQNVVQTRQQIDGCSTRRFLK